MECHFNGSLFLNKKQIKKSHFYLTIHSLYLKILRWLKKVAILFVFRVGNKLPYIFLSVSQDQMNWSQEKVMKPVRWLPNVRLCDSLQNLYQSRFLGLAAMASPSRSSQSRRRCKDGPRFGFAHPSEALALPRSTSDTDLVSLQSRSTLTVSTSLYCIGQSEDIVICWDVREEVDAGDWIGMYLIGENMSFCDGFTHKQPFAVTKLCLVVL